MRLFLDLFRLEDAPALFEADLDAEHQRRFEFPADFVPSIEHTQSVIEQWVKDRQAGTRFTFVFRDSESHEALGGGELLPLSETVANVLYWTRPSRRGRGVATQGLKLLRQHAFEPFDFQCLEVWVDLDNEPSRRVALAAGFQDRGTQGTRRLYVAERSR